MLPDFIVIGGMKCGTTSLWQYLKMHPEIFVPPNTKNLEFFNSQDNWDNGVDWYASHFRHEDINVKAVGEISTEYTKYPKLCGAPENMASVVPHAKLIYLIRDPVDRIISQYIHLVGAAVESRDIDSALNNLSDNPYIFFSQYYFQLEQYLRFFDKDQILLVTSEDLRYKRNETLKTIFTFIGADPEFGVSNEIRVNTRQERKRWNRTGKLIRRSPKYYNYFNYYSSKLPSKARKVLEMLVNRPVNDCQLTQNTRDRLVEKLLPDAMKLREFSGQEFSRWSL